MMRITSENAARAIAQWVEDPNTDTGEIAAVFEFSFAVVKSATVGDTGDIDVTPEDGFTEDDLVEEMENLYVALPEFEIPDLSEWPESLTDEILEDYGVGIETLRNAAYPVDLVIAAGMDEDTIRDRIEGDRIRTEKRCAD
jgi:hypothetical protein